MKDDSSGKPVVFVVDDDPLVRGSVSSLLRSVGLQTRVFASTSEFLQEKPVRAMKAGALEFLTKPFREQDMLDAVKLALERDQSRLESEKASSGLKSSFKTLTPREQEIMALVASGLMNKQVAGKIGLSEITVKVHRGRIMQKMGARTLADLVRMAVALGIGPSAS